ncbi:MAG: carboxypeptidase regulatory-like domain-containing protein [Desulfobacteraceae bacterium]|nr:carboxypeptidase regulatory-like domain-containing protein [Desulfobacteraceae bacterium]
MSSLTIQLGQQITFEWEVEEYDDIKIISDVEGELEELDIKSTSHTHKPIQAGNIAYTLKVIDWSIKDENENFDDETVHVTVVEDSKVYTVSGYIKNSNNNPIEGANLTFSNSGGRATTDNKGYYNNTVSFGWSGTVTPSKTGCTFNPVNMPYTNVTSDQVQDYTGICSSSYSIYGYVRDSDSNGISGITLNFSNNGGTVTTDSSGYYTQSVNSYWSGTVTPFKTGYTFNPSSVISSGLEKCKKFGRRSQ